MKRIVITAWLAALAGCGGKTYEIPQTPVGAIGRSIKPVFKKDGALVDPNADSDGDGISDRDELEGWTITVDPDGYQLLGDAEHLETRHVSSDPRWADTDGDGLSDGEERTLKSDPRRLDTDGDTLSDRDEIRRFGTSPASVDTDGDARGGGNTARPPLARLFDGNELNLQPDPANPGGPMIIGPGATAPYLADTDGDGVNDYDETLASRRRPTVADVPELALLPTPGAVFEMVLNAKTASGKADTSTYRTSTDISQAANVHVGTSTGIVASESVEEQTTISEHASAGCCFDLGGASTEITQTLTHDLSLDMSVGFDMSASLSLDATHTLDSARSAVASSSVTLTGGTVRTSLDVENRGQVTVRVKNLVILLTRIDRKSGKFAPVGDLAADHDLTLAPGEHQTVLLSNDDIPLQAMLDFFANPRSILLSPSRYDMVDQDGKDFDFTKADVRNRTATLQIDWGKGARQFLVAADADKTRGTTIGAALGELGIDYAAVPVDADGQPGVEAWEVRIGALGTEFWTGPAPDLGDALGYPLSGGPGPRLVKRGWFGWVVRYDESSDDGTFYEDLFSAPMHPGDIVTLVYSEDLDRDGLPAVAERRLGSSDDTAASDGTPDRPDGDGLSDFWEAREGWMVEWSGRAPYRVFPSPATIDSDGDGLRDDEERTVHGTSAATGTDPWMSDTDGDGRGDAAEAHDTLYGLDPLTAEPTLPGLAVTCTVVHGVTQNRDNNLNFVDDPYYLLTATATDAQGDLVEVELRHKSLNAVRPMTSAPTTTLTLQRAFELCPNLDDLEVGATDAMGNSVTGACGWATVVSGDIVDVDGCVPEPENHTAQWESHYP